MTNPHTPPNPAHGDEALLEAVARAILRAYLGNAGMLADEIDRRVEECWREWIPEAKSALSVLRPRMEAGELLHGASKAQHDAMDMLFAMLINAIPGFFPSKSGQPWEAMLKGGAARAAYDAAMQPKGETDV